MLNQVVIVGRIAKKPEIIETKNGKKVTNLNVAVQRNFKNADGIYETDFINCAIWNGMAENTMEYCKIGDIVGVKGRLQNVSNGDGKEYATEIVTERITFLKSTKEIDKKENAELKDIQI